jgi:hypothetical protein
VALIEEMAKAPDRSGRRIRHQQIWAIMLKQQQK